MKYVIYIVLFGLLAGCQNKELLTNQGNATKKGHGHQYKKPVSSHSEKDGAPPGPIPSWFKRILPKAEPFSRYGNPGSYKVDGRTYEVMTSSNGYRARGLASWYGTKFHSRRTSSGEDYDMYALTAAHKTLPLPTYVRVKNLSNGKQAIVKVNDRGPFHSGRIIDLSYGAAAKLGLLPKGTAPVEIEALSMTGHGKAHVARDYLQAGAYNSAALAQSFRTKVSKLTSSRVFVERYRQRFIVRVGPFANKQQADKLRTELGRHGVKGAFSQLM